MTDPMKLYQEKARAIRPPEGLDKSTIELIRRLEEEEGSKRLDAPAECREKRFAVSGWSRVARPLAYAAIVALLCVGVSIAMPLVADGPAAFFPAAQAIELESNRMFISDPRSSVIEVDEGHNARIVLDAELSCSNTGDAPLAVAVEQPAVFMRSSNTDEWRKSIVLEGDDANNVELSILVPVAEEDLELFRTGSPRAEAAYARVVAAAAQQLSLCTISLECDGFSRTEYEVEAEFDTDWQSVRRAINAGDRLAFSLSIR